MFSLQREKICFIENHECDEETEESSELDEIEEHQMPDILEAAIIVGIAYEEQMDAIEHEETEEGDINKEYLFHLIHMNLLCAHFLQYLLEMQPLLPSLFSIPTSLHDLPQSLQRV
jgi:hypothetical protein